MADPAQQRGSSAMTYRSQGAAKKEGRGREIRTQPRMSPSPLAIGAIRSDFLQRPRPAYRSPPFGGIQSRTNHLSQKPDGSRANDSRGPSRFSFRSKPDRFGSMPLRKIIHVDMDAFYASVEQRDDPALRGRPVAVGHGGRRGVVAAASYEARAFGVRSAMPSVSALRRCPELVFTPARFDVYRAVSRQIHAIFADYTELIEPLSLDEAYLDVTANRRGLATAWATAREIRARIRGETGLSASAGVSYNKFLAKLASDHRKPDGQFAVTPDMGASWVEDLPVGKFHGVGPVT